MHFDELIDRRNTGAAKWDFAPGDIDVDRAIIPLSVADMEFRSPKPIRDRLTRLAETGIWGYTHPRPEYFEALERWLKLRHRFDLDPEWIVTSTGVVQAIGSAVRALTEPGDKILIQTPVYHPFARIIQQNGRVLLTNELVIEDGHYRIDFDDFETQMASADMFILCSPHNPVGRVWDREELERMAEIAKRHDVIVLADEIHADFTYGKKHTMFSHVARRYGTRHLLGLSASKTFSLAGLGVCHMLIEDEAMRARVRQQIGIDGTGTSSTFGFAAVEAAYTECDDWYEAMLNYVHDNYLSLRTFVEEEMPKVHIFDLEGTYLAWLDWRAVTDDADRLTACMVEHGLYLNRGDMFGEGGRCFVRVNLACPKIVIEKAEDRMLDVYRALCEDGESHA